ncbi:conjugal transfer protein TraD [Alphaproteobacteria bacterium]|nr:conjugal transfer protein TraD [Alphaproteobacteria bacterium]
MDIRNEKISSGLRKKRTRTLIQLGGLLEKSGILENLDIEVGADIQNDDGVSEKVAELYGNIIRMKKDLEDPDYSPTLYTQIGKKELGKSNL